MGLHEILSISRDLSMASLVCSANHMHDSVCPGASTGDLCREMLGRDGVFKKIVGFRCYFSCLLRNETGHKDGQN